MFERTWYLASLFTHSFCFSILFISNLTRASSDLFSSHDGGKGDRDMIDLSDLIEIGYHAEEH